MKNKNSSYAKLVKIEKKCDRILAELLILRRIVHQRSNVDAIIDNLHTTARKMRAMCARERDMAHRLHNLTPYRNDS